MTKIESSALITLPSGRRVRRALLTDNKGEWLIAELDRDTEEVRTGVHSYPNRGSLMLALQDEVLPWTEWRK